MAKMTGAELLRSLRAEADRVSALGTALRDRIDTLADPTAAEAEVEAVRAAAEQRAATAEAKAADANMFPLLWPGALAGAFILPRRQPPALQYTYPAYYSPHCYPPAQYAPPGSWY